MSRLNKQLARTIVFRPKALKIILKDPVLTDWHLIINIFGWYTNSCAFN